MTDKLLSDIAMDTHRDIALNDQERLRASLRAWIRYASDKGFGDLHIRAEMSSVVAMAMHQLAYSEPQRRQDYAAHAPTGSC